MNESIDQAFATAVTWTEAFVAADAKVRKGDYQGALQDIENSKIPDEVKIKLLDALRTGEEYIIRQVFQRYEGRLGQVFGCEECWDE